MKVQRPDSWAGCHGMRVYGDEVHRFGRCTGGPLDAVEIRSGVPAAPGSTELWSQPLPTGDVQRMSTGNDGDVVLELGGRRVSVSRERRAVTVGEPFDWVGAQLVASFILPLLASDKKTLVLHASAACRSEGAVVLTGPGGCGKSSSLVGLVDAGWTPLSEDVCVMDFAEKQPRVWPGPPWIRRLHGEAGPAGAPVLFETSEKTAWDLAPFRDAPGPVPVVSVVVLGAALPGGDPSLRTLTSGEAIGALAPHAVWLGDRELTGRRLFGPVADAATRIPVSALRLPIRDDWVDLLVSLIDELVVPV